MKLLIINGPSGIGKSTLAEKLHREIPLSLLIDVDAWRRFISEYRTHRTESAELAYRITLAAVDSYLASGHSVIVEKAMSDNMILDAFVRCGAKHGAEVHEFLLVIAGKETLLQRAEQRGYSPDSLLTPAKVEELWESSHALAAVRQHAHVIDVTGLDADALHTKVRNIVNRRH